MNTVLIDNEWLAASLPDGFVSMPHDELEKLMGFKYDCMWGTRDEARHMVLCVTWKDANKFLAKLVGEKAVAKQINEVFTKRYRKSGYTYDRSFARTVNGTDKQAQGFRFVYDVEGVAQSGQILVFKRGVRCYTLRYFTRTEVEEENQPTLEAILASFEVR
jgi:hypothetical protein